MRMLIDIGHVVDSHATNHLATVVIPLLIGLLGTVAGVLANAFSAKWSDDRKLSQERQRAEDNYAHQARVARAVLRAELASMVRTFTREIKYVENVDNTITSVPLLSYLKQLREDFSGLGLLRSAEAGAIMTAFYVYQERSWYIRSSAARGQDGELSPPDQPVSYDLTNDFNRNSLKENLEIVVDAAGVAIAALDA